MTLREESLSTKENAPFASTGSMISFMQSERDNIERLTQEFLRKGGQIIDCDTGKAALECKPANHKQLDDRRKKANRSVKSKLEVQTPVGFFDGKNRRDTVAASGMQNISCKKLADGRTAYRVVIGSTGYGVFYDDPEGAKECRDKQRKILGIGRALY